jgi:hypothetical protein
MTLHAHVEIARRTSRKSGQRTVFASRFTQIADVSFETRSGSNLGGDGGDKEFGSCLLAGAGSVLIPITRQRCELLGRDRRESLGP